MVHRTGVTLVLFAAMVLVPSAASAMDVSIGLDMVSVGSDLGDIVESGFGLGVGISHRLNPLFALDGLMVSSAHEDSIIGADMRYLRIDLGGKLFFVTAPGVEAYGAFGVAFHDITFDAYSDEIDGVSPYFGAGVAFAVAPGGALDLSLRYASWDADWEAPGYSPFTVDASTTSVAVRYVIILQ